MDNEEELIRQHERRLLDWDFIHVAYCCEQPLYPSRIEDRTGISQEEVNQTVAKFRALLLPIAQEVSHSHVI